MKWSRSGDAELDALLLHNRSKLPSSSQGELNRSGSLDVSVTKRWKRLYGSCKRVPPSTEDNGRSATDSRFPSAKSRYSLRIDHWHIYTFLLPVKDDPNTIGIVSVRFVPLSE